MFFFLHIFLMTLAVGGIFSAVGAIRFFRAKKYALKIHKALNLTGLMLMVVGVIMALASLASNRAEHMTNLHHLAGITTLILVLTTVMLGFYQFKAKIKPVIRKVHRRAGYFSLGACALTLVLGLRLINII